MPRPINLQLFAEDGGNQAPEGGDAQPSDAGAPSPAGEGGAGGGEFAELRKQLEQLASISEQYEQLQQRYQLAEQYLRSLGIDPAMLEQSGQAGYGQVGFAAPAYGYGQVNPMDPYGMGMQAGLGGMQGFQGGYEDPRVRELQEQLEELKLQQEVFELARKYEDFEPNKDRIMEIAAELGGVPLEVAYRYWKVENLPPPPDIEKIKQEAIQEYLNGKRQAAAQPSPQGAGGGVPAGPAKPKNLDEADKEALRRIQSAFRAS